MENKFTPELIEMAKSAKTPEELMALAKENGVELTEESAKAYFEQLNPKTGELADEELNNVAGGGCLPWADDPYDTCMADGYCLSDYVCSRCGTRGIDFSTGVLRCSGCFASDPRCRKARLFWGSAGQNTQPRSHLSVQCRFPLQEP